jgi:CHASE2 domain-containing sensor protein
MTVNIEQHRAERAARRRTTRGLGLNILLVSIVLIGLAMVTVAWWNGAMPTHISLLPFVIGLALWKWPQNRA